VPSALLKIFICRLAWCKGGVKARQFGVPTICRSQEELLRLKHDAVLAACPHAQHAPMTLAALGAGLHVTCENLMANYANAHAMVAKAVACQRTLSIAFSNRFHVDVVAPYSAIRWLCWQGIPGISTWFIHGAHSGGKTLIDLGSHVLIWRFGWGAIHNCTKHSAPLISVRQQGRMRPGIKATVLPLPSGLMWKWGRKAW
jgi:hypothetical protein